MENYQKLSIETGASHQICLIAITEYRDYAEAKKRVEGYMKYVRKWKVSVEPTGSFDRIISDIKYRLNIDSRKKVATKR